MEIFVTSKDEQLIAVDSVKAIYKSFENGHACYIDGVCKDGFNGENSIVFTPDVLKGPVDYVAIINHSPFWCMPFFGRDLNNLPNLTQQLLAYDGEKWHCVIPVCDNVFKSVISGSKNGNSFDIIMSLNTSGITECSMQLAYVYEAGAEPHALVRSCAEKAAKMRKMPIKVRDERTYPEMFEYLGWCSWDSMHIHICHDGLLEKAKEFSDKKVPVKFAILDDMWANVPSFTKLSKDVSFDDMVHCMHRGKLDCFEGAPERFPNGMKAAIDDMKALGIENVGVWFPTTGYWKGFLPEGKDAKALADVLGTTNNFVWMHAVDSDDETMIIVKPDAVSTEKFFDEMCRRVKEWNGDFVKIDNQGFHKCFKDMVAIGESSKNVQNAIDKAVNKYFGGSMINCMGMASECMFNRPDTAVSRCSDDFCPESRDWFAKNILQCSYNSLLQGQFYFNDWDMWWTDDEQAFKNSICRAISGGPIYVSDKIGRTRAEILKPLSLSNGRILRPDLCASPSPDCLTSNPTVSGKIFKIQNVADKAGIMAVFNVDRENHSVSGTISPKDIPALEKSGTYAYYEYFTKSCGVLSYNESIDVTLENNDKVALYTFVPLNNDFAVMGRTDLFIGVKAAADIKTADGKCNFTLKEGGHIAVVVASNKKVSYVKANGKSVDFVQNGILLEADTDVSATEIEIG